MVCYLSAGSFEDWRPDAGDFPADMLGETMAGWPDERWLDIRRLDLLGPIMKRRLDQCRAKGFDGVEPDNVDGYRNRTGLRAARRRSAPLQPVSRPRGARSRPLDRSQRSRQVKALEPDFDWAINEECFRYDECQALAFVRARKAVFNVEYESRAGRILRQGEGDGLHVYRKTLALGKSRTPCCVIYVRRRACGPDHRRVTSWPSTR